MNRPLEETLGGQMTQPYFPVDMTAMRAQRSYTEIPTSFSVGRFPHSAPALTIPRAASLTDRKQREVRGFRHR